MIRSLTSVSYIQRLILLSSFFILSISVHPVHADWQKTLEQNFDIVETFDQLQDWTGTGHGDRTSVSEMPKKSDGSPSIWRYYSNWSSDYSATWIGNHGKENVWGGLGKSLCLDYDSRDGTSGPSRLAHSIGSAPDDGYPEEVYVFFLSRYAPGFFPMSGSDFVYFGYLKTLQISTGFRDIFDWGTIAEQNATDDRIQLRGVYGLNFVIENFQTCSDGDTVSLCIKHCTRTATTGVGGDNVVGADYIAQEARVGGFIREGEWFALEYRYKLSNPPGASNGVAEVWVYNKNGGVAGHERKENIVTLNNGSSVFDHSLNKFVLGGNRAGFDTASSGHLYIDDFVIHGNRIGPDYFALLKDNPPEEEVPRVTGLKVEIAK